jgi:transcriptional regulator with XRE-family HTH domain
MSNDHDTPSPEAETENPGSFATRLFHARGAHPPDGLTQEELAERAGLQQSAISHYEAGRREPNLANLRRLVWALGESADYLLATRRGTDDCYREEGVAAERQPERRYRVRVIPPEGATETIRAAAGDVEIVGRLYVLHAPVGSTEVSREKAAQTLDEALRAAHADEAPYSWAVLPDGWRLDVHDVEPV